MMRPAFFALVAFGFLASPSHSADPPKLELKDGDRIVYLGNTFVERDANFGYLETLLTIRHPDINFTFRNLGWSGDTVWGDARARFGTRADGFKHLKEHVLALKPTVILVAYGMNESFAGEVGLKEFEAGLNTLLDTLAETKARIFLITPTIHENLGPPLPDPTEHNKQIALYAETIRRVANSRGCQLSDIHRVSKDGTKTIGKLPHTDDGIHQTAYGYWQGIAGFEMVTKLPGNAWWVSTTETFPGTAGTTKLAQSVTETSAKFTLSDQMLPDPPAPPGTPAIYLVRDRVVKVPSLSSGRYALKIDGKTVANATADEWSNGVNLTRAPEFDQVEKLRALINKKNELYFYRWRPQNETYLFGFRKHEQGNNAIEIPQFDPLIAELEAEINKLKKPDKHTYELVREELKK